MTRRRVIRGAAIGLVLVAVLIAWRIAALPSRPAVDHAAIAGEGEVRVAYHVHTRRSDGTGTVEEVAAAARVAGLDAVILTDHGDGTRSPDPPRRIDGVLVIDAVEISTWAGHYVALGARPSPYPLGGTPASVVEDVARLGGLGIVAHPVSSKDDLKWRDWDAPFDGLEWLNADSEWRDRPGRLWESIATYPWAPVATITALLDRPQQELREWDRRASRTPVVGLAAHDAHARIGLRGVGEPYDGAVALRAPGYAALFAAFSNTVLLDGATWGRNADADATAVLAALRRARTYGVVTGRGVGRVVTFTARAGDMTAAMGETLDGGGVVTVTADTTAPADATTTLVCDGLAVTSVAGPRLSWTTADAPTACRLEVALAGAPPVAAPWIVTNHIHLRRADGGAPARAVPEPQVVVALAGADAAWVAEASPGSRADVSVGTQPAAAMYHWTLASAATAPFAALRLDTPPTLATFDRLVLRASADRPTRVWLQLRTPADGGHRWGQSVYLDATPRQVTLPFDRFLSLDRRDDMRVPLERVSALLVVVDTVHARPGDSGLVRLESVSLAR